MSFVIVRREIPLKQTEGEGRTLSLRWFSQFGKVQDAVFLILEEKSEGTKKVMAIDREAVEPLINSLKEYAESELWEI
jgi:hypothetical protein